MVLNFSGNCKHIPELLKNKKILVLAELNNINEIENDKKQLNLKTWITRSKMFRLKKMSKVKH